MMEVPLPLHRLWLAVLDGKHDFNGTDFAYALSEASSHAYKGVSHPVEGTILTVMKDAARAALKKAAEVKNMDDILAATVEEARCSVAKTPDLLEVLREAGVVDAGGQGIYVLLEGILIYTRNRNNGNGCELIDVFSPTPAMILEKEIEYGYCTEFLINGSKLNVIEIRDKLNLMGESVMVVGDDNMVRVHIHTFDPGQVISYCIKLGTLHKLKIDNLEDQHQDFLMVRESGKSSLITNKISIVAVVAGHGLANVFKSIGAATIIPGGQTMNPSVKEILTAIETVPTDKVIVLPNNDNVSFAAKQTQTLSHKKIAVLGETIPQGVAALLAFQPDADFESNVKNMREALSRVKTAEVTRAVRSTELKGTFIKKDQTIGFIDGEFVSAGDDRLRVVENVIVKMGLKEDSFITIYWGADSSKDEVNRIIEMIRYRFGGVEVEVVNGGQPHY
ncbi:MAG: DAK2 domain-containing protein, partial [Chloroflexi bacterium]|nr:DAK2 domain-containing protein [Chloroflexota bacterium]